MGNEIRRFTKYLYFVRHKHVLTIREEWLCHSCCNVMERHRGERTDQEVAQDKME